MELSLRVPRAWTSKRSGLAAIVVVVVTLLAVPSASADPFAAAADSEQAVLDKGYDLETSRAWAEAVQHYDAATRSYPASQSIYQRLLISRLHYDVNRRYDDHSFLQAVRDMPTSQALDLYGEILANLETHYVESVDWSRVLLHGTAALEVALSEESFVNRMLPDTAPEAIERFRQTAHRKLADRSTATRFDLRSNVSYLAAAAHAELGLAGTATVLEYVSGAVSTLDSYTRLLSGSQLDEMFNNIEGNFVGLGIELKPEEDALRVLAVIPGGPAAEAGMTAGEKIIRVESSRTDAVNPDYAADLLRGPEGSFVSLTLVDREGVPRDLQVQRRRVEVPCVENVHIVDPVNGVGYLRLTNFQKTTQRDIDTALWSLHRQGMRSLILDVRGNPGGLLTAAVEVADRFISEGYIVKTRGRNVRENFDYSAKRANTWSVPLVVLIDGDSASASEIFAGAISDSKRGTLIGETSFGKGSVQGIFRMRSAKFGLCLTTAKFYSPADHPISRVGVKPHIPVQSDYIAARPDDEGNLIPEESDLVLQTGLRQLTQHRRISQRP
ncbi:MAG: S41 family peptidase [Planctomycetota bacterium]